MPTRSLSPFKFSQHGDSGLWISELFPYVARHADELALIRSMHCDQPAHPSAMVQMQQPEFIFLPPESSYLFPAADSGMSGKTIPDCNRLAPHRFAPACSRFSLHRTNRRPNSETARRRRSCIDFSQLAISRTRFSRFHRRAESPAANYTRFHRPERFAIAHRRPTPERSLSIYRSMKTVSLGSRVSDTAVILTDANSSYGPSNPIDVPAELSHQAQRQDQSSSWDFTKVL
ncbi:DUF1501 domain-containing protein [Stieleria sedimenti]|uniref:DUF1501 domain-containing protein n=1 Tax=Stieleria sedimenti TaxID=2976331 RepID=UPI00389A2844